MWFKFFSGLSKRKVLDGYKKTIFDHYCKFWNNTPFIREWSSGPSQSLEDKIQIFEFPPTKSRPIWTYATCGMSSMEEKNPIELHLFSRNKSDELIELLTIVASYHRTESAFDLHHTMNFGRPWLKGSQCDHGFISLPYLDGPELETLALADRMVKCYWLIPITEAERDFKMKHGAEALEEKFESAGFDYADVERKSSV